ncbi:MAG: hypothetical protein IPF48_00005 [Sphingomonadales bacterium]|nr:hypothetical protein [Sphingomonadales bacterium]
MLDIGFSFYIPIYTDRDLGAAGPEGENPSSTSPRSIQGGLKDKHREAGDIMQHLGEWEGVDPVTGFHLIRTPMAV